MEETGKISAAPVLEEIKESPAPPDLSALDRLAIFSEKTRLAEYMMLMQKPGRLLWLNFLAGMARGVGMVLGGSLFGVLLLFITIKVLRYAFHHVGGLPWVGNEMEHGLQWVLTIVDKHKGGR